MLRPFRKRSMIVWEVPPHLRGATSGTAQSAAATPAGTGPTVADVQRMDFTEMSGQPIAEYLRKARELGCSDFHFQVDSAPLVRTSWAVDPSQAIRPFPLMIRKKRSVNCSTTNSGVSWKSIWISTFVSRPRITGATGRIAFSSERARRRFFA